MDKREFLKTSGAMLASTLLSKLTSAQAVPDSRTNWAGNYTYSTKSLDQAKQGRLDELLSAASSNLKDSKVGNALGGTGISFDWHAARNVFASTQAGLKLILAGGLQPANVANAIRELRPWGVDVSSGVEAHAGRKDPEKLAQFIQRAKALHG